MSARIPSVRSAQQPAVSQRSALLLPLVASLLLCTGAACTEQTLPWQLDHDRIIAVRATPPHIPADGRSALDILVTSESGVPTVVTPDVVEVLPEGPQIPVELIAEDGGWTVLAPDTSVLEAARAALGWPPDMPVPVRVVVTTVIADQPLAAIKTIYLGSEYDNPELGDVTIAGEPARDGITVPIAEDVALQVTASEEDDIDWMTSFGDLSDTDDTLATLRTEEPADGHVALVLRDNIGGVVWGIWQLQASE